MSGAVLLISAGSATAPSGGLPGMVAAICNIVILLILLGFIVYMVVDVELLAPKRPTPEQVAERAKEQLFTKLLTEAAQERWGK